MTKRGGAKELSNGLNSKLNDIAPPIREINSNDNPIATPKKYKYNAKGYLDRIETFYDKTVEPVETISFLYDPFGNLTERLHKKMNILVNELQLIYDDKTQLLYSIIRRDPSTNFMAIIRFKTYEYYP